MKMNKKKKVFLIVVIVVLLSIVCLIPKTVRSVKKVKYIVDLLTGERPEEEVTTDEMIKAFANKKNPAIYRKYAAEKLGHEIKDPAAVEPLIKVLLDKTEQKLMREEAAITLGLIGDARAVDALVEALNDKPIRIDVIKALTMINDEKTIAPLLEIAKNGTGDEKWVAASGLKVDRPEVVRTLINLIKNEPQARSDAIASLGETRTKNEEAFQLLFDILNGKYMDENDDSVGKGLVLSSTILALGKIGDKRAVEPLLKILKEDKGIRYIDAAIALGDIGDKRALEPLKKRMEEDKDEEWIMKDLNEAYRKLTE